jgi:hypothetical protein
MKPVKTHAPGIPAEPNPPKKLLEVADTIKDPMIVQSGVTTTADGKWALYITVPGEANVPISSVESAAAGFPVIYEAEPLEPTKAWPAHPDTDAHE